MKSDDIGDGEVTSADVADGSITSTDLAPDTIPPPSGGGTPDDNSVTSAKIVDGEVKSADIGDGEVTNLDLADNSVGNAEIINGAIRLSTFRVSGERITISATTGAASTFAACPPPTTLISGGYFLDGDVHVFVNFPDPSTNQWVVSGFLPGGGATGTLTPWALCATVVS